MTAENFDRIFCDRILASRSFVLNFSMLLVILFSVLSLADGQDNFYFSITPESKDVIEGRDVVLRCDVSKKQDIRFHWVLDDVRLTNSTRRYQHGSNLYIQRVNHTEDIGIFHCIATNVSSGYSLKSSEAVLNILWIVPKAEVQLRKPSQSDLSIGREMKLRCYVTGNPEPTYSWFKNDVTLTSNALLEVRDNLLIIKRLQSADSGVYSCQASNEAGYVTSNKNFLLNLNDDNPNAVTLDISSFKKTYIVKESTTAFLHCVYSNVIRTEWYHRSARLSDGPRLRIFSNGTLRIEDVKNRDEGAYVCRGIGRRNSQEFSSQLLISKLANFSLGSFIPRQVADLPFVVAQGKSSKLECIVPKGVPDPQYYWEDPNTLRVPSSGRIYADRNILYITNAGPRDAGQYSCVASNLSGQKKGSVNLVISTPPFVSKHPESLEVMEGAAAMMSCSFTGTPYPVTQILWQRDGKRLADRRRYRVKTDRGTLHIVKTEMTDKGIYKCVINTTDQDIKYSKPAQLKIRRKLKFTNKPVSLKLLEKDTVQTLPCEAEGPEDEPKPIVYWMPTNGTSLPPHVRDKQGTLEFNPVKPYDNGAYTCTATSVSQGTIKTNVQIRVVVRPKIRVKPKNTTAYEGFPVMMHCLAVGDPKPRVRWDKNSDMNMITNDERFTILPNGTLALRQVYLADKGMYGCTAGNSGGLTRVEMFLDVQTTDEYLQEQRRREEEGQGMIKTIIIVICCAVAYLGLVIGLTIYFSMNRMSRNRRALKAAKNETEMAEKCDDLEQQRTLIEDKPRANTPAQERTNFPRNDLQTLGMLGKGNFGDVFLAKARGILRPGLETQVLVKSLLNSNNTHHQMEFKRQMEIFRKAEHENVVRLLAVCSEAEPNLLVLEYCEWGDLKQFLRAMQRDNGRNVKVPPLTAWQKVTICQQISCGMDKLSSLGLVHKDLATRNVLLCPTLDVKISHLGLCRDVYAAEYYELNGRLVPIRWMAPEALKQPDRCTPRSDMWSFGVLCWEIFTLGDIPYRQEADEDVIEDVIAGQLRPQFPANVTPQAVQTIMSSCFYAAPDERHTFGAMTKLLREFVDSEVDV